jgi:hypothetical protein
VKPRIGLVPTPMPDVQKALLYVPDAEAALLRAKCAWNATQMRDALRSARFFIDKAEEQFDAVQRPNES